MADANIESLCHEAREHLKEAITALSEAAWIALEASQHELDKSLTAIGATIEGSQLLLVSLPEVKRMNGATPHKPQKR